MSKRETFSINFCKHGLLLVAASFVFVAGGYAQETDKDKKEKWGEGEIEKVEIEIVKERQIVLPKANRNFEKVPPRPVEPIKPEITYDFKNLRFNTPEYNPSIRPLRLQQEPISRIYGNYVSAGFGNYVSPYLEAYLNTKRDKSKYYGAKLYHHSFGQGPVDKKNSASGNTQVGIFGKSFGRDATVGGSLNYENISTHFYGYTPGTDINRELIRQNYSIVSVAGEIENSQVEDFNYNVHAGFNYLNDHYNAKESEVDLAFKSDYKLSKTSVLRIGAEYNLITRKDELIEAKPRHLLKVQPSYEFSPFDLMTLSIGGNIAYENDTIGKNKSFHVYPNVRAAYQLSNSVELYAALTGDVDKVSLNVLAHENQWVNSNIGVFHTNRSVDFSGGLKGKLGSKVGFGAGLSFANLKNLYFFQNDPSDRSKFITVYDEGNVSRTNFFGELSYAHAESAKILLRADYFGYSTDKVQEAWHRPSYRVSVNSSFNVYNKLLFNVDLITQGGMKAWNVDNNTVVDLDAAVDLNVKASYLFSKQFSAFIKGNNLLGSDYQLFLNYPVRGLQVMGGVTFVF